jgi:hypothetical protein
MRKVFAFAVLKADSTRGQEKEMVPSVMVQITWHMPGGKYHSLMGRQS